MAEAFLGAKGAVFIGARLLITLRDDRPDIPYPGMWDFPGGGRDGAETPDETMARELAEEVGLDFSGARVRWRRPFVTGTAVSWFFVLELPDGAEQQIVFGDEGQSWKLCAPATFLAMPDAVPFLQQRLFLWLQTKN